MLLSVLTILFLLASAYASGDHAGSINWNGKGSWRDLQQTGDNPCAVPFENAILPSTDLYLLTPSYFENCFSSLAVNSTLMIQHISSLGDTFQEYYAFYNIANDPANTTPISYQPELGYTLLSGPLEGQVNLDKELSALANNVFENGATIATFWDIQIIFNKLFDAHVTIPANAFPYTQYGLLLFPERSLNNATRQDAVFTPKYTNGEFQLNITWTNQSDGSVEHEKIQSMDGMTPYDFLLKFVSGPAVGDFLPYQSLGARFNGLFGSVFQGALGAPMAFWASVRPSDLMPESFRVIYESGIEETYYAGILPYPPQPTKDLYNMLAEGTYGNLDNPGSAYEQFLIAVLEVNSATNVPNRTPTSTYNTPSSIKNRAEVMNTRSMDPNSYAFDKYYLLPDAIGPPVSTPQVAFKIEADYAVLKVSNFAIYQLANFTAAQSPEGFAISQIWSDFALAAKAKGVKKAIIDVSGNGGGIVVSGTGLAVAMFPYTPYEVFQHKYDVNYNIAMEIYHQAVYPFINLLDETVNNMTDTDLQDYLDQLSAYHTFIEQIGGVTNALIKFCCDENVDEDCQSSYCSALFDLYDTINRLAMFRTGPQFRETLLSLLSNIQSYSPFKFVLGVDGLDPSVKVPVVRGGVAYNLTNQFTIFSRDLYYKTATQSFQTNWHFDEYIIVTDGACGSTTAIFADTATQLWKNRNESFAQTKLTTVTYGGTIMPSDTTIAGFPASVQYVNLAYPLITSGLLGMLDFVLPGNTEELNQINNDYQDVLPIPPYFSANLPRMPVYNFYSYFMEPGALPMMYVKIVGDKHIPQMYTKNSMAESADLPHLYKAAAVLGFSSSTSSMNEEVSESGNMISSCSNSFCPNFTDVCPSLFSPVFGLIQASNQAISVPNCNTFTSALCESVSSVGCCLGNCKTEIYNLLSCYVGAVTGHNFSNCNATLCSSNTANETMGGGNIFAQKPPGTNTFFKTPVMSPVNSSVSKPSPKNTATPSPAIAAPGKAKAPSSSGTASMKLSSYGWSSICCVAMAVISCFTICY